MIQITKVIFFLIFLISLVRANLSGLTTQKVALVTEDGSGSDELITCYPYSISPQNSTEIFVKYDLDIEEVDMDTSTWQESTNTINQFGSCASYAVEIGAKMFFFDDDTCETSNDIYERKVKTCNSTLVKIIYMLKKDELPASTVPEVIETPTNPPVIDLTNPGASKDDRPGSVNFTSFNSGNTSCKPVGQVPALEHGEILEKNLRCGVMGRKRCDNSVIYTERQLPNGTYVPHVKDENYFRLSSSFGCFVEPQIYYGDASHDSQKQKCQEIGAQPCAPKWRRISTESFVGDLEAFMMSDMVEKMSMPLLVSLFYDEEKGEWYWTRSSDGKKFYSGIYDYGNYSKKCSAYEILTPYDQVEINCDLQESHYLCCML